MKYGILLSFLFVSTTLYAKSITVEWSCSKESSEKKDVEISFGDNDEIVMRPDISKESHDADCIKEFKQRSRWRLADFKKANCPSTFEALCFASFDDLEKKVGEKFKAPKKSNLILDLFSRLKKRNTETTPESYLAEKVEKKQIDIKNLQQTFRFKDQNYKVSDFDKVIGDNVEELFSRINKTEAKQFMQNYLIAKSDVLNSKQPSPKRTEVFNNLKSMSGLVYGQNGPEELAKMLECKPEDDLKPLTDIVKKLEESKEVSNCDELKPGQYKVSKEDYKNYSTTGDYLLKRKPDGNYQAIVNVDFSKGTGSMNPREMLDRSKKCLAIASPYMKGPDGSKIEIVPMAPWEITKLPAGERPKVNDISIEAPDFETHSKAYAETADCPTITHEILHLLGLCDEYKEDRPQYSYGCRVVTKGSSIMSNHIDAFKKVVQMASICDCSGPICSGVMNSKDEDLKKLFVGEEFSQMASYRFRGDYCKYVFLPTSKNLREPSKSVLLLSDGDKGFEVETRNVSYDSKSMNFKVTRMKLTCSCPPDNKECLNEKKMIMARIEKPSVKNSCPSDSTSVKVEPVNGKSGAKFSKDALTLVSEPEIPSFLKPNHFYKILEGNCAKKSQSYRECGAFAYKKEPCGNIPKQCYDDNYYLGSEQ